MIKNTVLEINNLNVEYEIANQWLPAVQDVSLDLNRGECLAIVGESGSGKSTVAKACMGLIEKNGRITQGQIIVDGTDITLLKSEGEWNKSGIRGKHITMVMQNPASAMNPIITVGKQVSEAYLINHKDASRKQSKEFALDILRKSGFEHPEKIFRYYPCQMSGGMLQRAAIAMAMACGAEIVILDECTSALDVTTQAEILCTLNMFKESFNLSIVLITHDMGVVAKMADRVAVMYAGQIVEIGTCEEIFFDPRHPYTWTLFSSIPQLCAGKYTSCKNGHRPAASSRGDSFAPFNPYTVLEIDKVSAPPLFQVSQTHFARTWLLDPRAPKVQPPACIDMIKNLEAYRGGNNEPFTIAAN